MENGRRQPITNQEEMDKIRFDSEKKVAQFLLEVNPNLHVVYEPRTYTIDDEVAERESLRKRITLPDFEVTNPETGEEFILEVTEQRRQGCKNEQRKVMQFAAPGVTYIVFSRNDLAVLDTITENPDSTSFSMCGRERVQQVGQMILPIVSVSEDEFPMGAIAAD